MERGDPLVIVGGGLAGSLAALALAEAQPDFPLLLLEGGATFGGNHVWSFFDGDIDQQGMALIEALGPRRWTTHQVRFPGRARTLGFGYNSIHSSELDALVRSRLRPEQFRDEANVESLANHGVTMVGGEKIAARGVIDARGPRGAMPGLDLAWQKFVGIEIEVPGHGLTAPVIMDATIDQIDGYRFIYALPLSADRLLVEDTYYCDAPQLDVVTVRGRARKYAEAKGWLGPAVREETGVLPVLLDGDPDLFWPAGDSIPRLGIAGGFFHPTTGYSLPLAVRNALALARLEDFSSAALAGWTRARFTAHWRAGRFYRALNRMLFRAAKPDERFRVFEHFYRLPEAVIARFYAGRLSLADKARILTGKPPVPLGPALKALAG